MSIGSVRSVETVCRLVGKEWVFEGDAYTLLRISEIMPLARRTKDGASVAVPDSPDQCLDMMWIKRRYPFRVDGEFRMRAGAAKHVSSQMKRDAILGDGYVPKLATFANGQKPRDYQQAAADLWETSQGLLLADELGTGKTVSAIAGLAKKGTLPAVVVVPLHLCNQWKSQIKRFLPSLKVHVIQTTISYDLRVITDCPNCEAVIDTMTECRLEKCPNCKRKLNGYMKKRVPDVTIISYSKLQRWPEELAKHCNAVVFDEAHALRGGKDTERWKCAKKLCKMIPMRLLMTATPLFNLGGEAYNIIDCVQPGFLGSEEVFQETWCGYVARTKAPPLKEPDAFGSYLKRAGIMLRRTATEVGMPAHECQIIHHTVDADMEAFDEASTGAEELARRLLDDVAKASGANIMQLDALLRQATGIAKVPAVAAFTEMILEQGEQVVLFAWHRAVHDLLAERLEKWHPVFYTGQETPLQKEAAVHRFQTGDSKVIVVSLRAGEGLDGLQFASCTAVMAELDWTWSVHKQNAGRIARDGQTKPCRAYFLVSESGSDPIVSNTLGLKRDQLNGLLGERTTGPVRMEDHGSAIRKLARDFLAGRSG